MAESRTFTGLLAATAVRFGLVLAGATTSLRCGGAVLPGRCVTDRST